YTPPEGELGCVLIPSVGGDVFTAVDNSIEIGVYAFSLQTGEEMVDQQVSFAVLEDVSVEARLSASNVRTDEDGLAAVRVTAGPDPGFITVRAVTACANSVDLDIEVLELPTGDLRVSFNYPFIDVYEVAPVQVELYLPDTLRCRDFRPGEIPTGAIATATAASTGGSVVFDNLMVDQDFTVIAVGFGEWGERAAQGCADNVMVREGIEVEERIDLFLLPLNPVGTYEVISHWDFREAISDSGTVGAMLVEILDIFEDPGRGIQDFILGLIEDYVGGLISGAISLFLDLTGLDDVISDAINGLIDSSPLLSDIVTIGRDLRSIIAELEVISHLEIGKLGSDYEVFGVDNWIGLALYWRLDCDDT
ncbi:MAG: hypothetical protein KDA28_05190, partial [Phycisphaerales bacterium]|nr:hypothetical protein [Phycisphaerales bacterium]